MIKKLASILLVAGLLLTGCAAGKATQPVNLQEVYDRIQPQLPQMIVLDQQTMLSFLGIREEDCSQVIAAICGSGLQADEVWLVEAKDADALKRLTDLANSRLEAKRDETESYLPDQYQVVTKAKLTTRGNYLTLLISPQVDQLQAIVDEMVK